MVSNSVPEYDADVVDFHRYIVAIVIPCATIIAVGGNIHMQLTLSRVDRVHVQEMRIRIQAVYVPAVVPFMNSCSGLRIAISTLF